MDLDDSRRARRRDALDDALEESWLPGRHPAIGRLFTAPTQGGKPFRTDEVVKSDEIAKAAPPKPIGVKPDARFTLNAAYVATEGGTPDADDLERATWDFDKSGDYSVHDADSGAQVGEVVEIAFNRKLGEGGFDNAPENSVCAGIIWTPEAFPSAAKGEIRPRLGGPFGRFEPAVAL